MDGFGQVLAALTFVSFILLLPAFVWHIRNRNIPASSLIFWLIFSNLVAFVNACIWSGEDFHQQYHGQGYCDVVLKIDAGASSGKVAAVGTLSLNLYMILAANNNTFLDSKSRKKSVINLLMCWATPVFVIAVSYIIQSSRFAITRYKGCVSSYDISIATIFLRSIWSLLWAIIALVFALLTVFKYFQKRKDVRDILRCTNSGLDVKRFARLLIFSFLIILVLFPLTIYYFVSDVKSSFHNSFDYAYTHSSGWGRILFYDLGYFPVYGNWIDIGVSVITFLLFGLGSDAVEMYRSIFFKLGFRSFAEKSINSFPQVTGEVTHSSGQTYVASKHPSNVSKSEYTLGTQGDDGSIDDPIRSRMYDFGEYSELMDNGPMTLESPYTMSSTKTDSNIRTFTTEVDLEKASSSSAAPTPVDERDVSRSLDTTQEHPYQMRNKDFGYNFSVRENF